MYILLNKELKYIFNSVSTILFSTLFLLICGCLLWLIPGHYNIPENGFSSISSFFELAPILLLILIPALSMRTFSEEKKQGTLDLLYTRPVNLAEIILSKYLAVLISVCIVLIPTIIYVISIYSGAIPKGNIDLGAILGSYISLIILSSGFIAISVFASSLTSNQISAFITGLLICSFFYYGFDLIAGLFLSGKIQYYIKETGFLSHYQSGQNGVINVFDLCYPLIISALFLFLAAYFLKPQKKKIFIYISVCIISLFLTSLFKTEIDLTSDKRYTISNTVKSLLKEIKSPVEIECYLDGDLNPGFYLLQKNCIDMLNKFGNLSSGNIAYRLVNPNKAGREFIEILDEKGIRGTVVNEKNQEGKTTQQIIYPWLLLKYNDKELPVSLLINETGKSGEENLNASIESLEYQLAVGLKTITQNTARKIVFLQGHNELNESELADIFDNLSYNYQVDMGYLSNDMNLPQLNEYELIVVAGPKSPFSESEKFLLDQYVMSGGKILWLINGVKLNPIAFSEAGASPSMVNEINLEDMLFGYGIKINPVLLEDTQCAEIPVNTNPGSPNPEFMPASWYFAPILNPVSNTMITKGISFVKTEFASTLSFTGKPDSRKKRQVLLQSSDYSATVRVPEMISLHEINRSPDKMYFNQKNLPVAALLEGCFSSAFNNRPVPGNIKNHKLISSVEYNKMIVIASENVIKNEITGTGKDTQIWPLGYDRYMKIQFGNTDFILNSISYLTDDAGISALKTKKLSLKLLDKIKINENLTKYQLINILLPASIVLILFFANKILRRIRYSKIQ